MKIKKGFLIAGIILLLIATIFFIRFVIGGNEDSWIKNENGIWIKHGNPTETPNYVIKQQKAIEGDIV